MTAHLTAHDPEVPVLSAAHRLRASSEFSDTVRRGRRAGRPTLTVHLLVSADPGVRAGLVVSKAVGGSVVRHRVARQLRHLLRDRVAALPDGTRLVVRAAPAAAAATSAVLGADLDAALARVRSTGPGRPGSAGQAAGRTAAQPAGTSAGHAAERSAAQPAGTSAGQA